MGHTIDRSIHWHKYLHNLFRIGLGFGKYLYNLFRIGLGFGKYLNNIFRVRVTEASHTFMALKEGYTSLRDSLVQTGRRLGDER